MAGEQNSKQGKQKLDKHKEKHKHIQLKKATWQNTRGSDSTEDDELKHVSQ